MGSYYDSLIGLNFSEYLEPRGSEWRVQATTHSGHHPPILTGMPMPDIRRHYCQKCGSGYPHAHFMGCPYYAGEEQNPAAPSNHAYRNARGDVWINTGPPILSDPVGWYRV